jgi:KDO2-lipid IV(A) lauroyltransferase
MKRLRYILEYAGLRAVMAVFAVLPLDAASNLGGALARALGPLSGIHRKARRQIATILADQSPAQVDSILRGVWDNMGRTLAEYPHLATIARDRVTWDDRGGMAHLAPGTPALFFAGHFANWEVAAPKLYHVTGQKLGLIYRAANNPHSDRLLYRYRTMNGILTAHAKSHAGMRNVIEALKAGGRIGLLIDQKYTQGIIADFFGRPATSTTVYAQLGQRFACPVFPAQIIRIGSSARFHIIIHPRLSLFEADGTPRDHATIVREAHTYLEAWMREHPDQWLWLHQRWPKGTM